MIWARFMVVFNVNDFCCEAISLEFLWAKSGGLCRGSSDEQEGMLKIYT